ncbi:hypothetical protein XENORESO_020642 [Xenotaenia resolanae]|uniref:Uncharacterized protein n=1 Tax=Xenotaenia resolanae TaxID=208358 RepID=A0ABV0X0M2_9TELE
MTWSSRSTEHLSLSFVPAFFYFYFISSVFTFTHVSSFGIPRSLAVCTAAYFASFLQEVWHSHFHSIKTTRSYLPQKRITGSGLGGGEGGLNNLLLNGLISFVWFFLKADGLKKGNKCVR